MAAPTAVLEAAEETAPENRPKPGRWGLWAMGLVGGLVPSPTALLLLLGAVAIGRAWFGLVLVVVFGVGMAATLAVVGLFAHNLVGRLELLATKRGKLGGSLRTFLAYGAAVGVCLVGLGVVARTFIGLV